ncbi:MAG: hypothetical protein JXL80_17760 [Planctomycetes bacterium]|nr:hypothetical protein [Planctomycetota bacterium]
MADKEIVRTLHQVRRRLAVVRAVESGLRWAIYGAAATLLAVVASCLAYSLLPTWYVYPYMPLALIPAAFLAGVAARMLRPITLRHAAIYLDRRAGLHERVSTAYEFAREGGGGPLVAMVRDEALDICRRFRPSTITYGRNVSWQVRYLAVALLACGAILFLPPYKTADYRAREAFDARSRKAAETLRDSIRSIRQDRAIEGDAELQELLKKAEEEADRLANAKMAPARMLADMNRLQDDMKKEFDERKQAEDALKEAKEKAAKEAESVQAAISENPTEAEAQKAEDLAKRAAEGKATDAERSAMSRVGKAAEQAGRASGDAALEQAGQNVQAAAEGGQTSAGQLSNDLSRIASAGGGKGKGQGSGASQAQLKNAIDKVDQAKQASGQEGSGQAQSASASQGSSSGQGSCSACGGTGQVGGKKCSACNGTGKQGGGQQGDQEGSEGGDGSSGSGSGTGTGAGQSQPSMASTNMEGGGQGGHMELEENQSELPWARIYRPKSIDHTNTSEYSPGRIGKGDSAGSIMVKGPADPDEAATMDFTGDLDAYSKEAMKALADEHIPARQRQLVRDYFQRRSE